MDAIQDDEDLIQQGKELDRELAALDEWVRDDILCGFGETRTY